MNKARELDAALHADLQRCLGDRVTTSRGVRDHHGRDESYFPYAPPDAVVFPRSTEEVRDVVQLCRRYHTPIIPFGVGTSRWAHILPTRAGVSATMAPPTSPAACIWEAPAAPGKAAARRTRSEART